MNFERKDPQYRPAGGNRPYAPRTANRADARENQRRPGYYTGNNAGGRGGEGGNRPRPRPASRFQPRRRAPRPENKIYFLALLPTAEVGKEIIRLKQEFSEHYGARHALKVLPHITIQVPFTASPSLEKVFCSGLSAFAATRQPFEVQLDGFGTFPHRPSPILYISVKRNEAILDLHRQLVTFLRKEFAFSSMLARNGFSPHVSVAFNDLTDDQFRQAWVEYERKPFQASFRVNNLYLLRHNGASWEVLQKFRLGGSLHLMQ